MAEQHVNAMAAAYPRDAFSLPSPVLERILGHFHPSGQPPEQREAFLAQVFRLSGWYLMDDTPFRKPEKESTTLAETRTSPAAISKSGSAKAESDIMRELKKIIKKYKKDFDYLKDK